MIKRIIIYVLIACVAFLGVFVSHDYYLNSHDLYLPYSLFRVYLFNVVASVLIYTAIEVLAEKLPSQAGYGFLACVFLKIGSFVILFQNAVFSEGSLELFQRLSLIIPFFLFILIESIAIAKLLNGKTY
ncbi:MAG: DUF6168 family protein [Flavobacteriaceae bacterium]